MTDPTPTITAQPKSCIHAFQPMDCVEDYLVMKCTKCNSSDLQHFSELNNEQWKWVIQYFRK